MIAHTTKAVREALKSKGFNVYLNRPNASYGHRVFHVKQSKASIRLYVGTGSWYTLQPDDILDLR